MTVMFYLSFLPVLFGLALAGLLLYWDHHWRMALVQRGLRQGVPSSPSLLAWGMAMTGMGIGLFTGGFWVGIPELEPVGLAAAFGGLGLVLASAVRNRKRT